MSANVQKLVRPEDDTPDTNKPVKAPALGVSMQVDLGAGRSAVLQTHVDQEGPISALNALFDKFSAATDRVKARYDIEALERELKKNQRVLRQMEEDFATIENQHPKELADFDERIRKIVEQKGVVEDAMRKDVVNTNRRGPVKQDPRLASQVATAESAIKNLIEQRDAKVAERASAVDNHRKTVKRFKEEITDIEANIAERRAILDRG